MEELQAKLCKMWKDRLNAQLNGRLIEFQISNQRQTTWPPHQNLTGENHFDGLPDEILYKIFSMVPKIDLCEVAKVSQRFHTVCSDKRLWRNVSLADQTITYCQLKKLLTSRFPIEELNLTATEIKGSGSQEFLRETKAPDSASEFHMVLEKLDLTGFIGHRYVDCTDSSTVILNRSRTKKLILDRMPSSDDVGLMKAISNHEKLEVLSMANANFGVYKSDIDFRKFFASCSQLKELNLSGCHLTERQLRDLCRHIPETIEKLVLLYSTSDDGDYPYLNPYEQEHIDGYFELLRRTMEEPYKVLFSRAKKLKYFGAPFRHLESPSLLHHIVRHQETHHEVLETLCFCENDFLEGNSEIFDGALLKVATKLKKIDMFFRAFGSWWEKDGILVRLDKIKKMFTGIEVEVFREGVTTKNATGDMDSDSSLDLGSDY